MNNPFKFSGIVGDPAFCNREKEQKELRHYIENSQNVLLYSHRRYGKSSLILKIFKDFTKVSSIYVDLYGTTRTEDFVASFLQGISSVESRMNHLIKIIRQAIRSIAVNFTIDPITALPSVTPVFNKAVEERTIDEIFALTENLSKKKKMVIAFDEFQEVAAYGGESFEKRLRKTIQRHERISYIFAGSQRHLLAQMFNDKNRAFYMAATRYPLEKIDTIHYVKWINNLYARANRKIEIRFVENVIERCENHPMYVQEFFFNVWQEKKLSFALLDKIEQRIVEKRIAEYAYVWDALSLNQKRALKLIAGTGGKNIFSADQLDRHGFRTASQVSAALTSLDQAGFLKKNKRWAIHDPFFKKWLL